MKLPVTSPPVNVACRLAETARNMPQAAGVVVCSGRTRKGQLVYRTCSFGELERDSNLLAQGLVGLGVTPGTRLALLVPMGFDFISLVFALFKCGAAAILIDPGMGRRNVLRCLDEAEPQGFIAVPLAHAVRRLLRRRYGAAKFNVLVGRRSRLARWALGGATLAQFRRAALGEFQPVATGPDDPAAIIFTTGSTGPPKGVLYRHGNFDRQVEEIRDRYDIRPGEIDVACFPLFALFNCAMGVTTVVPQMDFSRPATVAPENVVEPVNELKATQAFASPAVWNVVARYCRQRDVQMPTLRRVLSAGAPIGADVLERTKPCIHAVGDVHTPYGATEALPVASIAAGEVLRDTAERTRKGGGVCVGTRFPGIEWKVIRIRDEPIPRLAEAEELPRGEIGELIVSGPVVTREYYNRPEANALGKIADGRTVWHRMGDVGYLDSGGRFWMCGRMAHRVRTASGTLFTVPCEAIFNQHPHVFRCALVGVGPPGDQRPVVVVEPYSRRFPRNKADRQRFRGELEELAIGNPLTVSIRDFLFHRALPVDIRHNAKIFREQLAAWAAKKLR